ncbi:MAG: hypothetical protein R6X25_01195 [Candidatus Krumholzibacteriia bacterium]
MKRILISIGILAVLGAASAGCNTERTIAKETTKEEQTAVTLVVPANTSVIATLDGRLSTETSRTGDSIALTVVDAIVSDGRTVVPTGSAINGTLRDVEASGRASGRAQMTLVFSSLTDADGRVHPLDAVPLVLQAESGTDTDIERMAAGGVLGAVIGGIAGGGKGAAIGAGAGIGAGVIVMLATQGDELVLEPGQKISVTFTSPMSIEVATRN